MEKSININVKAVLTVATFYKFVSIDDCSGLRHTLSVFARDQGIKGTILIAGEGINGTVSGSDNGVAAMLGWLRRDARFADLDWKVSTAGNHPFKRLKVKIKREIVSLGVPEASPAREVGTYVPPSQWNALIAEPDVLVIDTRNAYEIDIGSFPGAVDPRTTSFRQFPAYVKANLDPERHRKIAMFCTGGIRCEKASSYLLSLGFPEVYHLEGGILKYLETVPPAESLWQGECFVFDERVALEHGVTVGTHAMCKACGYPVKASSEGPVVSCPKCEGQPFAQEAR